MWVPCIVSCGIPAWFLPASTTDVFVLPTDFPIADREMLAELSLAFYRQSRLADPQSGLTGPQSGFAGCDNPDEFDTLVFWGSAALAPSNAFFLPVRNDVTGIGFDDLGREVFDDGDEFGSERLQGIIWIGPDWIENAIAAGPDSVLGILAQETAHRWGATIRFHTDELKSPSDELLGSPFHWSFLLDTGASPLGGNAWVALGDGLFRADPVEAVQFSALDLYLMGLLNAEEVGPIRLLGNAHGIEEGTGLFSPQGGRVSHPVTVRADAVEISIDQVVEVEGLRDPDAGFTAENIRQAWIYVQEAGERTDSRAIDRLRVLASQWSAEFGRMTRGRGSISIDLQASFACRQADFVGAR